MAAIDVPSLSSLGTGFYTDPFRLIVKNWVSANFSMNEKFQFSRPSLLRMCFRSC